MFTVRRVQWMWEHADLDCWTEEVELLQEERQRVEVLHCKTAEVWTWITHASDIQTGAAAYAYKVADVYTKLADHCIREWEKALKKVVENREEDRRMREREDELAREEEAKIRCEEEEMMKMSNSPDDGGHDHNDSAVNSMTLENNKNNTSSECESGSAAKITTPRPRKRRRAPSSESSLSANHRTSSAVSHGGHGRGTRGALGCARHTKHRGGT